MVLSRLTKITGPGVSTDTNWVGNHADFTGITTSGTSFNIGITTIHSNLIEAHNIKSTGILTATGGSFSGNVTAVDGTFSGNVSIAGTLTYEDVTNIDSVGIITAPALDVDDFLDVGSNIKLGNAGVITATSFVGSGAALTGIDATAIKDSGGNVKIQAQASGAIHTGVSTFQDIDVDGHTNLDNVSVAGVTTFSDNDIFFKNSGITSCKFDSNLGQFYFNGQGGFSWYKNGNLSSSSGANIYYSEGAVPNGYGGLVIQAPWQGQSNAKNIKVMGSSNGYFSVQSNLNASETFRATFEGGVNLGYYQSGTKLQTTATGIKVGTGVTIETNGQATFTGIVTASTYYGDGSNLSNITSTTINNNADNRVITGSGTANTLEGESGLTYSSNNLYVTNAIILPDDGTTHYGVADTAFVRGKDSTDGYLKLGTAGLERVRIDSSGRVNIGGDYTQTTYPFSVLGSTGGNTQINIVQRLKYSGDSNQYNTGTVIAFTNTNTNANAYSYIGARIDSGSSGANANALVFATNATNSAPTEKVRITSSGQLLIGTTSGSELLMIKRDDATGPTITLENNANKTYINNWGSSGGGSGRTNRFEINATLASQASYCAPYHTFMTGGVGDSNEKVRIASDGKVGINRTSPAEMLDVYGTIQCSGAGLKIDTHPIVSYANFTDISGGSYAARLGSTGTSTIRSTQIYGGGNHIATFDGVNYRLGVKTTKPQTTINAIGSISTGRNVARELGTVISQSGNYSAARAATNVINGNKNYENNEDWLAPGGQRVDAYLVIDLGTQVNCDRFVIYNQNEYNHSNREVKRFTLEGSNDNSSWSTILDDEAGCSNGHEPNPGWSFRMPAGLQDDDEGVNWRYWRFTMKTFHGSDGYGGVTELELYQTGTPSNSNELGSEVTTHSLVATDISAGTIRTCGQPSFLATASQNNVNIGSGGTFPFNTEQYDRTGSFNTSTYQFTAPVTGEYFFFYQVYRNSSTSAEVAIYVNNDAVRRNRCQPNGGDFIFQQSTIIRLTDGDVVDLRSYNGNMDNFYGSSSNQRESHFGGYLLG